VLRGGKEANLSCGRKYIMKGGDCGQRYTLLKSETVRENVANDVQNALEVLANDTNRERFAKMRVGMDISLLEEQKEKLIDALSFADDEKSRKSIVQKLQQIEEDIAKAEHDFAEKIVASPMIEIVRRVYGVTYDELKSKPIDEWLKSLDYHKMTTEQRSAVIEILVDRIYINKDGSVNVIYKPLPDFPAVFSEDNKARRTEIETKIHKFEQEQAQQAQ
jgi:hypothetical protein